jgi:asparagine synthase (glutamine-hydrolysing)
MCGIAGIVNWQGDRPPPEREALLRMISALHHRGPDEAGLYRDERAGLAHTRLSIIDLATGQQPLCSADESRWIVFNGEIFNYLELRAQLEQLGHQFRTRSDTEVLLQAYEAWGDGAFARLNGQWAMALWDGTRRKLVLSRDAVGICPLFFHERGGVVTFASEAKAIFASNAAIERRLDPQGVDETFTFWSVVPPQSVFQGIHELRPGHTRIYQHGTVREFAHYSPTFPSAGDGLAEFDGTLDGAVELVRAALDQATELRMLRSDVPVGSYLSGGLDSSLVAALGRRSAPGRFHTFSLRFEEAEYDETSYQRLMVEQLGSQHHELLVTRSQIGEAFPEVIYHTERPILRTAPAPLFLLSKHVRQAGIKVVLTGEGADEVFAGYDLFREGKVRRFWARDPASQLRPRALERLYPYLVRSPVAQRAMARQFFGRNLPRAGELGFAHELRWQGASALKRLYSPGQRAAVAGHDAVAALLASSPPEARQWGPLQQDQYLEMRTLLAGYLLSSQGDRMLMAHSLEGRFPFLDPDVVALAASLPARYKLRVLDEKHIVKQAAKGHVPPAILARKKQPYRAPDASAFTGASKPAYLDEVLSRQAVAAAGLFDPTAVAQLHAKCDARAGEGQFSNADNMALVGVISTQLLHHQFIATRPEGNVRVLLRTEVDRSCPLNR